MAMRRFHHTPGRSVFPPRLFPLFCGLVLVCALSGCTSIPKRNPGNALHFQELKPSQVTSERPVTSEFQTLANEAHRRRSEGGTEEYVSILEKGDDALLARIHLIRAAANTIDLQTFIWKDDPTSRFVFDELVKAAQRGVTVRMLIDALNLPAPPHTLAQMARAHRNLQICLYKPLDDHAVVGRIGFWKNLLFKAKHMNRRMHNKLLLIDGRIGIAGGRNYEGKYYDRDLAFLFRDRDLIIAGPAVEDMEKSFDLFWQDKKSIFLTQLKDVQKAFHDLSDTGVLLSNPENSWMFEEIDGQANHHSISRLRAGIQIYEADQVQFVSDTPRKLKKKKSRMDFDDWFEALLASAEHELVYQTPYLIYNRDTRKAFEALRKKYPDFKIIASSNSLAAADHLYVYALSFKHRKQLYKKTGIDIYEAKPYPVDQASYVYQWNRLLDRALKEAGRDKETMEHPERAGPRLCIHAKSLVLDEKVALIGSHNFDPRSAKLNTECGVFIIDEVIAGELKRLILNACEPQNAWTVSKAPTTPVVSHFSGFIGSISSVLPIFDVWPYRYTTNYALKDGRETLPPRDKNFQTNYQDVGYFPEVPDSSTVIQTRLMKSFFGWTRPLM